MKSHQLLHRCGVSPLPTNTSVSNLSPDLLVTDESKFLQTVTAKEAAQHFMKVCTEL